MSAIRMFYDDCDQFLTCRPGWISRRSWDPAADHDEWVWGPHIGVWLHPTSIECDGFGLVCWGPSERQYRDSIHSHRQRVYDLSGLQSIIEDIERWGIPDPFMGD